MKYGESPPADRKLFSSSTGGGVVGNVVVGNVMSSSSGIVIVEDDVSSSSLYFIFLHCSESSSSGVRDGLLRFDDDDIYNNIKNTTAGGCGVRRCYNVLFNVQSLCFSDIDRLFHFFIVRLFLRRSPTKCDGVIGFT